jgi:hypothetical protein
MDLIPAAREEEAVRELRTEIEIQASPEKVWGILTDLASYTDWNPFIHRAVGTIALDEQITMYYGTPGTKEGTLHCTVRACVPNQELRWSWRILVPALYTGEHSFVIEPLGAGRVRFVDREVFSGLLSPLFAGQIDTSSRRGFEAMDQALKARAETI